MTGSTNSQPVDRPSLADFECFCDLLWVEDGSQLVLHDFQKRFLKDYFDGTRETLVLLPKKNGKSTIIAALALCHLLVVRDAECVIAAASRDQATIILGQARKFIRWSLELQRLVKMNQRQINHFHTEGRIRVLASDEDTADGVIPTLAIVDELHRHKSSALYGVFRDGLGPRKGRMITISTAGDDEESPLGLMREKAYQLEVKRDGCLQLCEVTRRRLRHARVGSGARPGPSRPPRWPTPPPGRTYRPLERV